MASSCAKFLDTATKCAATIIEHSDPNADIFGEVRFEIVPVVTWKKTRAHVERQSAGHDLMPCHNPAMKPKWIYAALCIAGFVAPYSQFVPWVVEDGLDLRLLIHQLFANRIGAFFGMDVIVSRVRVAIFAQVERGRLKIRLPWLPLVAVLTVGASLGLPLLLFLRELALEAAPPARSAAT